MKKISALISCFLLIVGAVTAQTAQPEVGGRLLPQWLTGLLALICFLILTFVAFLVKKVWCEGENKVRTSAESGNKYVLDDRNQYDTTLDTRDRSDYDSTLDMVRSRDRSDYDSTLDMVRDKSDYDTTVDTRSRDRSDYDITLDTRSRDRSDYDITLDMVRSREDRNAYDNLGIEKVTSM